MLPDLNKKNPNRVRFVINDKYYNTKSKLESRMFDRLVIKEFSKQCGDVYYHGKIPLSINIEVRVKVRRTKEESEEKYITNLPDLNSVISEISNALVGALYDNVHQIAELFVTKIYGNENRIVVEIERL